MMYREDILKNGLRVVSCEMPAMESVSLGVWVRAGVRYEDKKINGVSHLLEHLLFKGTKRRDTEMLKREIEGRGGSFNGFTAEEHTCYLVKVLAKNLSIGVDVLSDMVSYPLLKEKDIRKEKSVIIEEINMYKDLPNQYIHELLAAALWPNQPLGAPLAGSVASVRGIQRRDILEYKDTFYGKNNMVVIGVGRLKHRELIRACARYFKKDAGSGNAPSFAHAVTRRGRPRLAVHVKNTEQTHAAIGFHSCNRFDEDRYSVILLNIILGANMSSRLFREVRERLALCYEIASSVRWYDDTGAFVIHAGIDYENIGRALAVIMKELRSITKSSVGKAELQGAKEYYKGQLLFHLEDTMSAMLWLGEKRISGESDCDPKRIIKRVDSITPGKLREVANEVFTDENLTMAIIGPIKNRKRIEKALHIS